MSEQQGPKQWAILKNILEKRRGIAPYSHNGIVIYWEELEDVLVALETLAFQEEKQERLVIKNICYASKTGHHKPTMIEDARSIWVFDEFHNKTEVIQALCKYCGSFYAIQREQ